MAQILFIDCQYQQIFCPDFVYPSWFECNTSELNPKQYLSKWLQFGAKAFCVFTEIWTDFVPESAKPGKRTLSLLLTVEKQSSWTNLA